MLDTKHVFISYARKDGSEYALKLDAILPKFGFRTWRDKRAIDPSHDFTAEIEKAIEASAYVITCITPDVRRDTSFVRREIAFAQVLNKPIIVARFADVPPPISVVNNSWVDFFTGWEDAFGDLLFWLRQSPGNYIPVPPTSDGDPFKPYLEGLYKQIVRYLDQTVFTAIPGSPNASLMTLESRSINDAVSEIGNFEAQVLPIAFFSMAGVDLHPTKAYRNVHDAFLQNDGRLLVLGQPGSGKTTTLMAVARDAVVSRLENSNEPLPILAPIASWDIQKHVTLEGWLQEIIPALSNNVSELLNKGQTLLILDGIDELGNHYENPSTKETFDPRLRFIQTIPYDNQILISCRSKDYWEIGYKVPLKGAVELHALSELQIQNYLSQMNDLWDFLRQDQELMELVKTPLLLSLLAYAFAGLETNLQSLKRLNSIDLREQIFSTYTQRRLEHERRKPRWQVKTPLSIDVIYRILGEIAMNDVGGYDTESNVYKLSELRNEENYSVIELALDLNLLIEINEDLIRFTHQMLRDHFAYQFSIKNLRQAEFYLGSLPPNPARALGKIGDARVFEDLVSLVQDDTINNHMKAEVVGALGLLKDKRALPYLKNLLKDKDDYIRDYAVDALGLLGDIAALPYIVEVLDDVNPHICNSAVRALGKLGDTSAVGHVIKISYHSNDIVRNGAAYVLGELQTVQSLERLIEMLEDERQRIRDRSRRALVKFGNAGVKYLENCLKHADWKVRVQAQAALREINTPEAHQILSRHNLSS